MLTQKFFLFCDRVWKHPLDIISQTSSTTNIFVWRSDLKTQFHADRRDSNYQIIKRKVFFISLNGLKMFYGVYYQTKVHSKYFCLMIRLRNLFHGDYRLKWQVSFVWYQAAMILKTWYGACLLAIYCFLHYTLFIFLISILTVVYTWLCYTVEK